MFFFGAALIGGYLYGAARNKSLNQVEQRELLGPKSGRSYTAELDRLTGILTVRAADGSIGTFEGTPTKFRQGRGRPDTLRVMVADFVGLPIFKAQGGK